MIETGWFRCPKCSLVFDVPAHKPTCPRCDTQCNSAQHSIPKPNILNEDVPSALLPRARGVRRRA
jgi:hypothetical protein